MSQPTPLIAGKEVEVARLEEYLDRATDEVFNTMMGVRCAPTPIGPGANRESISAVIGLAGALSGSLVLQTSSEAARRMAEKMMGMAPEEVDEMVRDAVGEVCNMVAGAWKGFESSLASGCLLSTPTVVAGSSYELFNQKAPIRIERGYIFETLPFTVTISCEPQG
ncbi:MAG TPA: chemotaxis protein CheX [Acidobacteriaceae bacterium]|nr:chemotaxis protein CheX [Acidobacteriaceae bacterium]